MVVYGFKQDLCPLLEYNTIPFCTLRILDGIWPVNWKKSFTKASWDLRIQTLTEENLQIAESYGRGVKTAYCKWRQKQKKGITKHKRFNILGFKSQRKVKSRLSMG